MGERLYVKVKKSGVRFLLWRFFYPHSLFCIHCKFHFDSSKMLQTCIWYHILTFCSTSLSQTGINDYRLVCKAWYTNAKPNNYKIILADKFNQIPEFQPVFINIQDVIEFHYDYCLPSTVHSSYSWISSEDLIQYIIVTQKIPEILNFLRFQDLRWMQVTNKNTDLRIINISILVHLFMFTVWFWSGAESMWQISVMAITGAIIGGVYGNIAIETRRAYRRLSSSRSPKENRLCCV